MIIKTIVWPFWYTMRPFWFTYAADSRSHFYDGLRRSDPLEIGGRGFTLAVERSIAGLNIIG